MKYANIPAELKSLRQWVVWRLVIRTNEKGETLTTKPPFNPRSPQYNADVAKPDTWGTYDEAVECLRANPSIVEGIGFVFTKSDDFFGIDIDDEAKVEPEFLEARRAIAGDLLSHMKTYAELSPSGKGLHMIARGRMPEGAQGKRNTKLQIEVYGSARFFTMTGNVFWQHKDITDQQAYLDKLYEGFTPTPEPIDLPDIDTSRRIDLTDEEVVRLATNFNSAFGARYLAQVDCDPGKWSETFMSVVGILDRFSGKVEQIERIVMSSPMVTDAPNAGDGETRVNKAKRNFRYVLARVRQGNNGVSKFAEHGRKMFEQIEQAKAQRAAAAAEAIRKADATIALMSKGSSSILNAFLQLDRSHLHLSRPPGVVGRFVEATEDAMFNPFTKFAIPATIAALAGVVARGYKLPGGQGLNVNVILAAPSATGKTQTMQAWDNFMGDACRSMDVNLASPPKSRILITSTSSIQGITKDFMETPSVAWFVEECASLLNAMSHGVSNTDSALRDSFNQLYDCGRHGKWFSPPRSVANAKADIKPIDNLNVSTFWTTTPSKFDIFNDDALDGFLSRVVVIRHLTASGAIRPPSEVKRHLPEQLHQVLLDRMTAAKKLDETYALSTTEAAMLLTTVSTTAIDDLFWGLMQIADRIKVASLNGDLPPAYTAISRVPITAQRIASVLAVIENPYTPSVTEEQLKWSFGYLLQNLAATLNDMDTGEMGVTAAHDVDVVVREMKKLLRKTKGVAGIPKGAFVDHMKRRAPFKDAVSPSEMVKKTILDMMGHGRLMEGKPVSMKQGKPGPLVILYCPTDDEIWH